MHELLVLAAETESSSNSDGGLIGLIIAGVVSIIVTALSQWLKRKDKAEPPQQPTPLSPAEREANLNYQNLRQELKELRAEFARYKTDTEESEGKYRRQVGVEMDELRATVDFKDDVINLLDDEVLDLRDGLTSVPPRYPPLPPRKPRPRRNAL